MKRFLPIFLRLLLLAVLSSAVGSCSLVRRTIPPFGGLGMGGADRGMSEGEEVVHYALQYIGKPYKYGASGPSSFDCSGFTAYVYQHFGKTLNRSSRDQWKDGYEVSRRSLQAGDLVFFGKGTSISHVGIVVDIEPEGEFRFIHASSSIGITISKSTETYWKSRYRGARRVLD